MEREGSGVSALVGLDGFVVRAQLLDEPSGEWWLAVESTEDEPGARPAACERSTVAVAGLQFASSRSQIVRRC